MSKYKENLLANLEAAQVATKTHLATALDDDNTLKQRKAAFKKTGSISDEVSARKALEIVKNPKSDDDLRSAALAKVSTHFGKDESFLSFITDITTDKSVSDELRLVALTCLQKNSFSSPMFLARRPNYIAALRALIDDPNSQISETAIEYLALNQDEYVQRRLIDGLESPKRRIVKPELAVQFLSYDLHADHFPLLRKLASKPPNKKTRMEALRNLQADSASVDLMKSAFTDKKEDAELRHLCGVALQRLAPDEFDKAADKIMRARSEHSELKGAIVNTRLHLPSADVSKLESDVKKLAAKAKSKADKTQISKLSSLLKYANKFDSEKMPLQRNVGITLDAKIDEFEFGRFVDGVRSGIYQRDYLVSSLHSGHAVYQGRGANQVARMRGYLLASFATLGLPDKALVHVLEVLENSQKPYLVAAAAIALRGVERPTEDLVPFLRSAISNVRYRDEAISFVSYAPDWPRTDYTTALAEILKTLAQLGQTLKSAADVLLLVNSSKAFSSIVRKCALEALDSIGDIVPQGDQECCSRVAERSTRFDAEHVCQPAELNEPILLEDQHGCKMCFKEAFCGRPTIVGFFYTRCGNPNKCSLTITKLAQLRDLLAEKGLASQINVAAITYDPGHDSPDRLRGYCKNRGFVFDESNRAWRTEIDRFDELRQFFDLGASYSNSIVSRHEIELYILDANGALRMAFTKLQWQVESVLEQAITLLVDAERSNREDI